MQDQISVAGHDLTLVQNAILQVLSAFDSIPTQQEIADKTGLGKSTVQKVLANDKFQAVYHKICLSAAGAKFGEVLESTVLNARMGSEPHQKLYYKLIGKLFDQSQKYASPDFSDDDPESLEERKKKIEAKLADMEKEKSNKSINTDYEVIEDEPTG